MPSTSKAPLAPVQADTPPAPAALQVVSTALAIAGTERDSAPSPEIHDNPSNPNTEAPWGLKRERDRMKLHVLCRKAGERTEMLERGSRELIETSKKLVSESKRRNQKALESVARCKAA